jgi:hypothetical protein
MRRNMFVLRCGSREIPLAEGGCLIGRGADCQVILNDALVSRRHAFLKVAEDRVTLQDLGSRNGIYINGDKIASSVVLSLGDEFIVGETPFMLTQGLGAPPPRPSPKPSIRVADNLAPKAPPDASDQTGGKLDTTAHADLLGLLGTVADKSIAQGHPEQAERLLTRHLQMMLQAARGGRLTDLAELELAAKHAVKLAIATSKPQWVEFVFDLYAGAKVMIPAAIIDELYEVVRKVGTMNASALDRYLEVVRPRTESMLPAERFVLQRAEGLRRVVLAK